MVEKVSGVYMRHRLRVAVSSEIEEKECGPHQQNAQSDALLHYMQLPASEPESWGQGTRHRRYILS